VLEVDRDGAATSSQHVESLVAGRWPRGLGPVDPDDVRTKVSEHHCAERPRADPGHLDHTKAVQGTHG
jgi:hypothetical protein